MAGRGIPRWLLDRMGHDVQIEPYMGSGAYGPVYAAPVTVRALVDGRRRLVRSAEGSEVVSETTLRVRLGVTCPPLSRVTLPDGTQAQAITTTTHDGGKLPVPSHLEIALT
ncbi:hypothetical protein ITP53_11295 [Nonomuraea sp. K274]|uniref:Uncharacterized protein n=1 Tax=Nonomuraea cypriaca TaxID=1187855 RepID=A0A931F0G2_9ACTN|nr:hypothetical protein [Nonomuraea cypriaca]MBF8186323.1 hypothetical protein [Nonomuraea cypriaca]